MLEEYQALNKLDRSQRDDAGAVLNRKGQPIRPIDADALLREIIEWPESIVSKERVQAAIASAPTIAPPPNATLTLDELREMNGEPVYCLSCSTGKGGWAICKIVECGSHWYLTLNGGEQTFGYDKDTLGKSWLAYRNKPEE